MEMGTHLKWKVKPVVILCMLIFILLLLTSNQLHPRESPVNHPKIIANKLKEWKEPDSNTNVKLPGEQGKGVMLKVSEKDASGRSYREYGFNQFISDKISLHRSLLDVRPIPCHYQKYEESLPKVSVIIIFHNEGWSTLLRTVHSVLNRSPPELLHEIILCDDASTKEHLKGPLVTYVNNYPKVKLVRTKKREGLIRARVYGADHSNGEVLLFLDSHCEANVGWLPPLLSDIAKDDRTVTCPSIDVIRHYDFSYIAVDAYKRGTFNWRFDYKEKGITAEEALSRKSEVDAVKSPVMAGGLFAISRRFWEELGKYDPGMYVWGGEQYEISFKLWMCGGQMLNIPCSRVGHVYRDKVPYKSNVMNAALINFKRVAEVWMDGFKEFLYYNRPDIQVQVHGDTSDRKALRERLKCKSFAWYLDNVANDTVRTRFEPDRAEGKIRHIKTDLCLDLSGRTYGQPVALSECGKSNGQDFHWTYINEFRRGLEDCLDVKEENVKKIYLERCHEREGNQRFAFLKKTQQIQHESTGRCITVKTSTQTSPTLEQCDHTLNSQQWNIELKNINKPMPEWAKIATLLKNYSP